MSTAVVGAGPVGLVVATGLARAGEDVLLVDADPGPAADGSWRRTGVMQFSHPHFFRHLVRQVLEQHTPELWDAVVEAGCVVNAPPEGVPPEVTTVAARRSTLEGALRTVRRERVQPVTGTAERVLVDRDRAVGVVVDGATLDVDRVVVATGRTSRFADDLRPEGESSACGVSYVSRMYQALPGVEPLRSWVPLGAQYDGYLTIAFPQDAGTHSVLVVRPSEDAAWEALWRDEVFDSAMRRIPNLAPWTDPERFRPITSVMRGGSLINSYRGQGTPPAGVLFVGDAVCTTNPSAGRGISLGLLQAGALLDLLAEHGDDRDAGAALDAWCAEQIRPWYVDHVVDDAYLQRRYRGEVLGADEPLPSDLVCDAMTQDPSLAGLVMPYLGMVALPGSLAPAHDRVRELMRSGWRPTPDAGPTRDELLEPVPVRAMSS